LITQNHETLHFLKTGGGLVFFEKVANGFFLFFLPGEKRLLENIKFPIINNHETFCFLNLKDGLSAIHVLIREGAGALQAFRKRDLSCKVFLAFQNGRITFGLVMNTPTFLITTQTLENYGAHDKDGRFSSGNAYWKFKGGNDYIITGLKRVQDAVAFVAAAKCGNGIGYKEFPAHWEEVDADYRTTSEEDQLRHEGEIRYPADRINVAEFYAERQ